MKSRTEQNKEERTSCMGNNPPITISNLALSDSIVDSAESYYSMYKSYFFLLFHSSRTHLPSSCIVSNIHLRYSIRCYSVLCYTMSCCTSLFYAVPMILRVYLHVYYHPFCSINHIILQYCITNLQ